MQVSVENGEGLERRVTVIMEPERIESEVENRLRDLSRSARLPGFRPGKVPVALLRQRFGERIHGEVIGEMVQSTFGEALGQVQLNPVGQPSFDLKLDPQAKHYSYIATFEVLPDFELGSLTDKVIKRPVAEVTDADLEVLIERLREQRKTFLAVERPAQDGDLLKISYAGTLEGETDPLPGGSGKDRQLVLGSGQMIPGFEAGLLGVKAGEERQLELTFPEEYHVEHLRAKPVSFAVTVHSVEEPQLPAVDAEFAKAYGVADGNLDQFRLDVRTNMARELKQRIGMNIKTQVMELLLETNPIVIPKSLLVQEIQVLKNQSRQSLPANTKVELPDSLFVANARRRVALGLILAKIVKVNDLKADPERVREAVLDLASTYEDPKEVVDFYYSHKEHLASLEAMALEGQVVDWVTSQVQVEEVPRSFNDLISPA